MIYIDKHHPYTRGGGYMGKHNKTIHMVAFLLLVVGGLNWLLVGIFDLNVVNLLGDAIARVAYILIGASAVYVFATHKASCKTCSMGAAPSQPQQPPMQQ